MNGWSESEFRFFVQGKIMHDPDAKRCQAFVKKVARKMGLSPWALYDILNGRIDLTPDRIPVLCNAIKEVMPESDIPRQILVWIISRCDGFSIIELFERKAPDGEVDDNMDDLMIATASLFKKEKEMLRDGLLDDREKGQLYLAAMQVRSEVDSFMEECRPQETAVKNGR